MWRFLINKRYAYLWIFQIPKNKNMHYLSKAANLTSAHLSNMTDQWQKENLLKKIPDGRETKLEITQKGKELIKLLQDFFYLDKKGEGGEKWKKNTNLMTEEKN